MTKRRGAVVTSILAAGAWFLVSCDDSGTDPPKPPPPKPVCTDSVTISVAIDTVPVFSWSPDCRLGRLLVEQGFDEYWGTETCGENTYESPIRFGVNPPNTCPEEPAIALVPGLTYQVSVFRFVTVNPESLQLLGRREFAF